LRATPPASAQSLRVFALRELLDVLPLTRMPLPPELTDERARAVARSSSARTALELNLAAMVLLRRRGEDERAAAFAAQLDSIRLGIGVDRTAETAGLTSLILTQQAIGIELRGDSGNVIDQLREAYRLSSASQFDFSRASAAARLALANVRDGHVGPAERWLERAREAQRPRGLLAASIHGVMTVAEAMIGLATLDQGRTERALARLNGAFDADEYWVFAVQARAERAALWGTPAEREAELAALRRRSEGPVLSPPIAGPLLAMTEVKLLLALGRGNEARIVLDGRHSTHPMLDEPRALLALLTGDVETAHRLALLATDRRSAVSPARRLALSVVIAVALLRQGRGEMAALALRRAVYSATTLGLLTPFAQVPSADLQILAANVAELGPLLGEDLLHQLVNAPMPAIALVTLTDRERTILTQLARGLTAAEIAVTANVSVNTVRTQRQGLYRKLGVTSRAEALRVTITLGLLPPSSR
jgi:LuxR family maltose regulon positive regulatory protein